MNILAQSSKVLVAGLALTAFAVSAQAQGIVKIGDLEAQTGSLNTYGWMSSQGVRMAVDEINKAGGFQVAGKTYKLELSSPDTQGNPQQALIQLKKMLEEDKIRFVFGPFLTNIFKGIEGYAKPQDGHFLLMGGATQIHYELAKPGNDYLVRTWNWDAGPSGFGTLMVEYLKKRNVKKVAMLMQNDAFGHVAADIYREAFKAAGIEFTENWFEPGTKDYSAVLSKIGADKPDYLFPGYTDAVLYDIVQQATQLGLTKFWLVRGSLGPALKNKDYIDDYVAYIPKYFEQAQNTEPKVKKFVEAYKAFYKKDFPYDQAPLCSSSCYDHVFMLVEAMKRAGTVDDVARVKAALLSFTYEGLWNIRYDKTGEEVINFDIVDVQKGGKITVNHQQPK
ncbi:MAG: ABC transporter substrate-binding protein [Caldimonas sp.]|nr:ABC transporter substrate-binding protein [Pseudomonadota bacterium]